MVNKSDTEATQLMLQYEPIVSQENMEFNKKYRTTF